MKRRDLLSFLFAVPPALCMPRSAAIAQQTGRVRRLGVLMGIPKNDPQAESDIVALEQGLQQLGWMSGQNIVIDYRWPGGDAGQTAAFASELVERHPDVLLSRNTPATAALKKVAGGIPLVFVMVVDPVSTHLVESLARPGESTTGFTNFELTMAGKWLDLLKEISPATERVAFFFNPKTAPFAPELLHYVDAAAPARSVRPIVFPVQDVDSLAQSIRSLAGQPNTGLVALPDAFVVEHRMTMIELAAQLRMPAVYPNPICVRDGGLMAYGIDNPDLFRRAATYIDRILKGEKPTELPVQRPTKFQLLINMKAANALGVAVPPMLLATADEVIE